MQVVALREARELFEQPDRSPLDADYQPWCVVPAAEFLVQAMRAGSGERFVVETPDADAARAGLARYSAAHVAELSREISAETKRALITLVPTSIVFAASLALSRWAVTASSDWVSATVSDALIVIGWVVLWAPVAILGTDIWVLVGRRRAYRRLDSAQVEVRPA
jgi:hypothetical protein